MQVSTHRCHQARDSGVCQWWDQSIVGEVGLMQALLLSRAGAAGLEQQPEIMPLSHCHNRSFHRALSA